MCTMLELGIDRIMFAVDYPYVVNQDGMDWIEQLQLSPDDKRKLVGDERAKTSEAVSVAMTVLADNTD